MASKADTKSKIFSLDCRNDNKSSGQTALITSKYEASVTASLQLLTLSNSAAELLWIRQDERRIP
jgi:hypothetical protein